MAGPLGEGEDGPEESGAVLVFWAPTIVLRTTVAAIVRGVLAESLPTSFEVVRVIAPPKNCLRPAGAGSRSGSGMEWILWRVASQRKVEEGLILAGLAAPSAGSEGRSPALAQPRGIQHLAASRFP